MYRILLCLAMMLVLSSCSFFEIRKPIIEQGNIISSENVARLHQGMSAAAVAEVMGTPVLSNILTPNRMEYIYTYKDRSNPLVEKRVSCLFVDGKLQSIQKL